MEFNATLEPPRARLQLAGGLAQVTAVRCGKGNVRIGAVGNRAPDLDMRQDNPADRIGVVGEQVEAGGFMLKGGELWLGPDLLAESFPLWSQRAHQQPLHPPRRAGIRKLPCQS